MCAYYLPRPEYRQVELDPSRSAICFIDTQNYNCSKDGAIYKGLNDAARQSDDLQYYFNQVDAAIPRWQRLQQAFRAAGAEVIFTVIQSLTQDGRDRGLDYKISGFHCPPGSFDAAVLPQISPQEDEMVLPKTSSSVFNSTVLHYVLQNLGVKQLVLCGCVTDQCVEHAVRDACDLGYFVTLITDASVTYSEERQRASLSAVAGYCRERTTAEVVKELERIKK